MYKDTTKVEITGIKGMSREDILREVEAGGKFVMFRWVFSFIFFSTWQPSDIIFLKAGQNSKIAGLPYTLLTLFLGFWSPTGVVFSIDALQTNLSGGDDKTALTMAQLGIWEAVKVQETEMQEIRDRYKPTKKGAGFLAALIFTVIAASAAFGMILLIGSCESKPKKPEIPRPSFMGTKK